MNCNNNKDIWKQFFQVLSERNTPINIIWDNKLGDEETIQLWNSLKNKIPNNDTNNLNRNERIPLYRTLNSNQKVIDDNESSEDIEITPSEETDKEPLIFIGVNLPEIPNSDYNLILNNFKSSIIISDLISKIRLNDR